MADLRWNSVNANFNDANSAMGNSLSGLSQAGTIFGDLRKSILDEEQKAIDNAYREKDFEENVRQFGLNYDADAPLKKEQTIATQLSNSNTEDAIEAQNAAKDANTYFSLPAKDKQLVNERMQEQINAFQQSIPNIADPTERKDAERQLSRMQAQYNVLTAPFTKETLTANERANRINSIVSLYTGQNVDATRAASELELGQKLQAREDGFEKDANLSIASARKGLFAADQKLVDQAIHIGRRMATRNGELDWEEYNRFLAHLQNPHTNADGKQGYDKRGVDLWGMTARETADALKEYINSDGTKGSLAGVHAVNEKRMMEERAAAAKAAAEAASGTGDKPDDVNPATLTLRGLDYLKEQRLKDLPNVKDITIDSPEVQERMVQLLRARFGNMSKEELTDLERKSLEEDALQQIIRELQQQRTQAISDITKEKSHRENRMNFVLRHGVERKAPDV